MANTTSIDALCILSNKFHQLLINSEVCEFLISIFMLGEATTKTHDHDGNVCWPHEPFRGVAGGGPGGTPRLFCCTSI